MFTVKLFLLLFALSFLIWMLEVKVASTTVLGKNAGARVSGPLFSMSASGTIGKAITYGIWKGRPWCRVWFKPENPKTDKQVNVRLAMSKLVVLWQALPDVVMTTWDDYADQFGMSGFNQWVKRGMLAYTDQLGSAITPVGVTCADEPPNETFTWVDV